MTIASPEIRESPQPHRFTRADYYRMAEMGLFDGIRVELIEGEIVEMAAQKNPHVLGVSLVAQNLTKIFADGYWVRTQAPLSLGEASDPEPDVAVARGDMRTFKDHPRSALLVVEVSDSTLRYDQRTKASLYAKAGIAEYWIVNLIKGLLEVHRDPMPDASSEHGYKYRTMLTLKPAERVSPLARPDAVISVAALLP